MGGQVRTCAWRVKHGEKKTGEGLESEARRRKGGSEPGAGVKRGER